MSNHLFIFPKIEKNKGKIEEINMELKKLDFEKEKKDEKILSVKSVKNVVENDEIINSKNIMNLNKGEVNKFNEPNVFLKRDFIVYPQDNVTKITKKEKVPLKKIACSQITKKDLIDENVSLGFLEMSSGKEIEENVNEEEREKEIDKAKNNAEDEGAQAKIRWKERFRMLMLLLCIFF